MSVSSSPSRLLSWAVLCLLLAHVVLVFPAPGEEYGQAYPRWWSTRETPRPAPDFRRFDPQAFDRWCAAQPPEARPLVEFIRRHLTHVTQAEFETQLAAAFELFQRTNPDRRPLLVVTFVKLPAEVKSNAWATALLRDRFPDAFRNATYFNLSLDTNARETMEQLRETAHSGRYRVVLIDDAAYSGQQLADGIVSIAERVNGLDVIVPYATNHTVERLRDRVPRAFRFPFAFHRARPILTIEEMIEALPPGERAVLARSYASLEDLFNPRHGLTIFEHKRPDFMSFPHWISEGYLLTNEFGYLVPNDSVHQYRQGRKGTPTQISFIAAGGEPYRCPELLAEFPR